MKKIIYLVALSTMALLQGCSSTEFTRVANDAMSGAIDGVLGGTGTSESVNATSGSYSVESEKVVITDAKKTKKDFGKITVIKTEKNPKNQTKLRLDSCTHPRIGSIKCGGYLYEVTEQGWLKEELITFDDLNHSEVTLAAGEYYIKAYNWDSGMNRFVTGEFSVKPFVTNLVALELE
ncbi:hypothetical protein [Marinibactrum halimedae]|uniref:Lipoprotein n=1 Tax=Marinibactrum halimedae TaxID=1444977 RepID=A0AA37T631_9GAMM|nr:hypothetical protein [Marinibactrum halimedae]MCD9459197.1 hypothetical protein [Marinibactrum halimedae]GLS27269.1 hypothetical protein GCM10007877_29880 [Marinibactrum halimedae]